MLKKMLLFLAAVCLTAGFSGAPLMAGTDTALMRFPDIHGDQVVFVHGEDIWKVSVNGGSAVRLTIHDGEERFPKFSPDGKMIAFTAEYDGNQDVYVMDENGGGVTRLTYHPDADNVVGWHPVRNKVLFSSSRSSYSRFERLFLVNTDGSGLEELPIHEITQGCFSPDGRRIAYNKTSREFRTWKRYKGGRAQDVYVYDFETQKNERITDFDGTDRIPMWIGDKICFASDRDKVLNIYAYDTRSKTTEPLTRHKDYDARRPSEGGKRIVYELGGSLWVLDVESKQTRKIPVTIDVDPAETRVRLSKVNGYMTDIDLSPSGKRALITARGDLFTVPRENGSIRNLTESSGARDKNAVWSPDGKQIAWLSDAGGEYDVYVMNVEGRGAPLKLTSRKSGYPFALSWSPDSRKLAFTDQTLTLTLLDALTGKETVVDRAQYENVDVSQEKKPIHDYAWSPDSRYMAYVKMDENLVYHIHIYSLESGKHQDVSEGIFNDFSPAFTRDGKHLLFISNRRFNPTYCDFEWEMVYKNVAGIYALTLRKDGERLLPLKSDEEGENRAAPKTAAPGTVKVVIDFDGLARRVEALPLKAGNYRALKTSNQGIFYLNKDEGDFNFFEFRVPSAMDLYCYDPGKRKERSVIKGIQRYALSADGSSIAFLRGNDAGIIDASTTDDPGRGLKLQNLAMWVDPVAEWTQLFNEAWRLERDYYYDENMHGLNWNLMKEKYGKLIRHASCRQDVVYIIGELIGELNTSHTYVYGGDRLRRADRINVGMLGVDWTVDDSHRLYRFGKIYTVPDWSRGIEPPLAGAGRNVKPGDYLLMVNGRNVSSDKNIYSYFQNLAGEQVTLTVNGAPTLTGSREVKVRPAGSESQLRYLDWVEHNRLTADQASGGQIGYLHLPDTYLSSSVEFPKYFFAMGRKKGIIVDGRFNGGGLDPEIFLKRLNRKPHAYWTRRYSQDQTSPVYAPNAHLVCLTNRQAGSGGDELPEFFRHFRMGPVIGTRTWGGLVGVSMFIPLMDGGGLTAPDYRIYTPEGKWTVENVGVTPDIVVDLDPAEMQRGYDAQLQEGIKYLLKKIKDEPRPWPKRPERVIEKLD